MKRNGLDGTHCTTQRSAAHVIGSWHWPPVRCATIVNEWPQIEEEQDVDADSAGKKAERQRKKKAARLFVWVCVVVVVCSFSSTKAAKNVHSHITIRENPWRDVVVIATSLGRPVVVVVVVYLILLLLSLAIFL